MVARCWRRISPPVKRKQRQNINILWSSRYEPLSRLLVLQNETETDTKHHDLLSALSYHNSTWPISISNLKYSNIIFLFLNKFIDHIQTGSHLTNSKIVIYLLERFSIDLSKVTRQLLWFWFYYGSSLAEYSNWKAFGLVLQRSIENCSTSGS